MRSPGGASVSLLLLGATLASYLLGFALGSSFLLPLLNTAPGYWALVVRLGRGERISALRAMGLWAGALIVFGTLMCAAFPERAEAIVINGAAYRDTMLHWVATGEGEESHPSQFIPLHALHLALYVPIALLTAGLGGMVMGSILTNYMDFFVASLALRSTRPLLAALLGWFPWSLLRVAGYVILGVLAAEPLLGRLRGRTVARGAERKRLLGIALALFVADVVVKSLLAPRWGALLSGLLRSP